jgi:hypothetical protein
MNNQTQSQETNQEDAYDKLVEEVAERVWQLWREEVRHEHERRGQQRRK